MTPEDVEILRNLSRVLWDSLVWQVGIDIQHSFEKGASPNDLHSSQDLNELCLEFQRPLPVPEGLKKHRQVGTLQIDVRNCGVRLQKDGEVVVNSGDSTARILAHLPTLVGKRLVEIQIDAPGGDTRFMFEETHTLTCFPDRWRQLVHSHRGRG